MRFSYPIYVTILEVTRDEVHADRIVGLRVKWHAGEKEITFSFSDFDEFYDMNQQEAPLEIGAYGRLYVYNRPMKAIEPNWEYLEDEYIEKTYTSKVSDGK